MLRNIIGAENVTEIKKNGAVDIKRGQLVTKDLTNDVMVQADAVGVDVFIADFDAQPTGHLSDVEVSAYDATMDTIEAGALFVSKKYPVGAQFGTDQVDGTIVAGNYLIAGTSGKEGLFVVATTGQVSTFKALGEYADGAKTLQRIEVVNPVTVA